jgi:hypothetical protein
MNDYPNNTWTDEDVDKLKSVYLAGVHETKCPVCGGQVVIEKQESEEFLKKKYVNTHFFLVFECKGCKRRNTKTYRKSA